MDLEEIDCARGSWCQPGWNQRGFDLISSPLLMHKNPRLLFTFFLFSFFFVSCLEDHPAPDVHSRFWLFVTSLVLRRDFLIRCSLLLSIPYLGPLLLILSKPSTVIYVSATQFDYMDESKVGGGLSGVAPVTRNPMQMHKDELLGRYVHQLKYIHTRRGRGN